MKLKLFNYNYILALTDNITLKLIYTFLASDIYFKKIQSPLKYIRQNLSIDISTIPILEINRFFSKGYNMFPMTSPYNLVSPKIVLNGYLSVEEKVQYIELVSLLSRRKRYEHKLGITDKLIVDIHENIIILPKLLKWNFLKKEGNKLRFLEEETLKHGEYLNGKME